MEDNYQFICKSDKPLSMKILGGLIAIPALIKIRFNPIFGSLLSALSIGLLGYQRGIEIDFKNKRCKEFIIFGPQKIGNWSTLSNMKYISVFKANMVSKVSGQSGASVSSKESIYQVNLIHSKNAKLKLFQTLDINEAFAKAEEIAPKMDLKIWDATTRNATWYFPAEKIN
jgi:hypothetical protein